MLREQSLIKIGRNHGVSIADAKARLNLSLPLIKQKAVKTHGE
jgi:hypothetical protein